MSSKILFLIHFLGPLPPGLNNLRLLFDLELHNNYFTSYVVFISVSIFSFFDLVSIYGCTRIPDNLTGMISLASLSLGFNALEGTLPTKIGGPALTSLFFENNAFTGTLPAPENFANNIRNVSLFIQLVLCVNILVQSLSK